MAWACFERTGHQPLTTKIDRLPSTLKIGPVLVAPGSGLLQSQPDRKCDCSARSAYDSCVYIVPFAASSSSLSNWTQPRAPHYFPSLRPGCPTVPPRFWLAEVSRGSLSCAASRCDATNYELLAATVVTIGARKNRRAIEYS